jgi:arginine-tRNA-protein transferase
MDFAPPSLPSEPKTRVQLYGINKHECGYCHSGDPEGSISYGAVAETMKVTDYEALMLEGWRRSGTYCYKPAMLDTCCPPYTIRLDVNKFRATKSQKKVLRRFERHATSILKDTEKKDDSQDKINVEMQVTIEPVSYSEEKFELYKKYQTAVHNDKPEEVTSAGFTRFLVETPLINDTKDKKGGSYHHLYRLNGRLVAVGVVDRVSSGLSSVYCFYDPDCRDLVLGKYVALKEIEYCQQNGLAYYYMGFYIHSCEKMRYKGEYAPSELRCPTTHQWIPLADCVPALEKHAFTPFVEPYRTQREQIEGEFGVPTSSTKKNEKRKSLESLLYKHPNLPRVDAVPIDIPDQGVEGLSVRHLTRKGQEVVTPMIQDWMENCGEVVAKSASILF